MRYGKVNVWHLYLNYMGINAANLLRARIYIYDTRNAAEHATILTSISKSKLRGIQCFYMLTILQFRKCLYILRNNHYSISYTNNCPDERQ